jgi:hypothetical protein
MRQASTQVWQWLVSGFQYGYEAIKALPSKLVNFAKGLYQWFKWGIEFGKWLGKKILFGLRDFIVDLAKGLWNLAANTLKLLKDSVVALARGVLNFFKTLPEKLLKAFHLIKDALIFLKDKTIAFFRLAYQFAKDLIQSLPRALRALYNFGKELITAIARNLFNFFKSLPQKLLKVYHFIKNTFIFFKDLAVESAKLAYRFGKYLLQSLPRLARAIYNFGVEAFRFLGECLKEIGNALLTLAKKGLHAVLMAAKDIFVGILKKISLGIGMVYGISAAFVGFGMDSISAFSAKYLGLQLAQNALFTMSGTALSFALSCFILYQLARVSLYALSSVLALSFLKKSKAKDNAEAPKEKAALEPSLEISLEGRPKALLNQYPIAQRVDEVSEENSLEAPSQEAVNDEAAKIKKAV